MRNKERLIRKKENRSVLKMLSSLLEFKKCAIKENLYERRKKGDILQMLAVLLGSRSA